jgi:hypothetical protein
MRSSARARWRWRTSKSGIDQPTVLVAKQVIRQPLSSVRSVSSFLCRSDCLKPSVVVVTDTVQCGLGRPG